jgi:hypothetical protein
MLIINIANETSKDVSFIEDVKTVNHMEESE